MDTDEKKLGLKDNRDLVVFWLLVFFPVGLWLLWTGSIFEQKHKIMITVGIVVALLIGTSGLNTFLYLLVAWPIALYLLWRNKEIARKWLYIAGGVFAVLALIELGGGGSALNSGGGSCAAVMTQGNCTYYRDDNCNVVARQCS